MRYWIHFANVLYLVSYLVRDILWLRVLTVVAAVSLLPYYVMNWLPEAITWNCFFIVINLVQIKLLLLRRLPVWLNEKEKSLYARGFRALSPREFSQLLKAGTWTNGPTGELLIQQGQTLDKLMVIVSGKVDVLVDNAAVATLGPGQFIGEMSFMTKDKTSASVTVTEDLEYVAWPRDQLEAQLKKTPEIRGPLQLLMGADIANKLKSATAHG